MKLELTKERLMGLLTAVNGAVETRHTISILANIKFEAEMDKLTISAFNMELELIASIPLHSSECGEAGSTTIPAKKLLDICKSLPSSSIIKLQTSADSKCVVTSKKSKFTINTLPSEDFPCLMDDKNAEMLKKHNRAITLPQGELKRLMDKASFAMAVRDVRFYLTGSLIEFNQGILRLVSTDGHRLAMCETVAKSQTSDLISCVVPCKAITEAQRLLASLKDDVELNINRDVLYFTVNNKMSDGSFMRVVLATKLIDGKFPDYNRVIPKTNTKIAVIPCNVLKDSINRVAILSNEKLRQISLSFSNNSLTLKANDAINDRATEDIAIAYDDVPLEMFFNPLYLTEVLNIIGAESIEFCMHAADATIIMQDPKDPTQVFVVMPMRK